MESHKKTSLKLDHCFLIFFSSFAHPTNFCGVKGMMANRMHNAMCWHADSEHKAEDVSVTHQKIVYIPSTLQIGWMRNRSVG